MPKYDKNTQLEIDYLIDRLGHIEGGTITHVGVAVEDWNEGISDTPWWQVLPVLTVTMPDGLKYQCVVLQDPEGNGPGHLDIDLMP